MEKPNNENVDKVFTDRHCICESGIKYNNSIIKKYRQQGII